MDKEILNSFMKKERVTLSSGSVGKYARFLFHPRDGGLPLWKYGKIIGIEKDKVILKTDYEKIKVSPNRLEVTGEPMRGGTDISQLYHDTFNRKYLHRVSKLFDDRDEGLRNFIILSKMKEVLGVELRPDNNLEFIYEHFGKGADKHGRDIIKKLPSSDGWWLG